MLHLVPWFVLSRLVAMCLLLCACEDGSGDIDYHEFVNQLHKLKFQAGRARLASRRREA